MKTRIKNILMSLAIVLGVGAVLLPAVSVGAVNVDPLAASCKDNPNSTVCKSSDDNVTDTITTVINVLLFIIGIISVIMIIVGGITYAVSAGDATAVGRAKSTILYAIVGLAVAFFAYAIVNWVVARFI